MTWCVDIIQRFARHFNQNWTESYPGYNEQQLRHEWARLKRPHTRTLVFHCPTSRWQPSRVTGPQQSLCHPRSDPGKPWSLRNLKNKVELRKERICKMLTLDRWERRLSSPILVPGTFWGLSCMNGDCGFGDWVVTSARLGRGRGVWVATGGRLVVPWGWIPLLASTTTPLWGELGLGTLFIPPPPPRSKISTLN